MPLTAKIAALVLVLVLAGTASAATRPCARFVVVDSLADPGTLTPAGAVLDIDPRLPVDQNASVVGGIGPSAFLAGIASADPQIFVSDLEADPSRLGPDPNGNPGHGAIFRLDDIDGGLILVADGTACDPGLPGCGPGGIFVDPIGLAFAPLAGSLLVADLDADPSGLGPDTRGFAGHGALFRVDPGTGAVSLVSDGSSYAPPIPAGYPSIFEDPLAVAVARDGTIYVADQLSTPLERAGLRSPGAVFRVDGATGLVTVVAVIPRARGVRDVAVEPSGTLLVLDRIADGGTIFRVDPSVQPPGNVLGSFILPPLVDAHGLVVEGNGTIHVVDGAADPLDRSTGALFTIDAAFSSVTPLSVSPLFAAPWGLDLISAESLDTAAPAAADAGTSLTVTLTGGIFDNRPVVDFGTEIVVDAVRVISPTVLEVDITIQPGMLPQLVDVVVGNPTMRTHAFHCELFEVRPSGAGCAPSSAVGDTLLLRKLESGEIELDWDGSGDTCAASAVVRRSFSPRPATEPGDWPTDPAFEDITALDGDGSSADTRFLHVPAPDPLECFLVTEVGTNGVEGPSGHY